MGVLRLQGDIVSCAGTYIHVWSINGSPISSANTFTGRSQQILCCCVSEMNEWDTQNVIVTGHSDGVVRVTALSGNLSSSFFQPENHVKGHVCIFFLQFWRMEFLQVPETPAPEPIEPDVPDCCADEKIGEFCKNQRGSWRIEGPTEGGVQNGALITVVL